jgi:uncharacterized protein YbjT (DUF2867 family)
MKVLLFGASGMIGQGVLRECLRDPAVESVLSIVRNSTGQRHEKLREIVHADFFDFSSIAEEMAACDACFFCLGVSSARMSEQNYRHITYDITLAAAETLVQRNLAATFIYISGAGADSTERGRSMWARVRGATENALLRLPFKAVYNFRPGLIIPLHGIRSRTRLYRLLYTLTAPVLPLLKGRFTKYVTTTEQIGRAMILATTKGAPKQILESEDINNLRN